MMRRWAQLHLLMQPMRWHSAMQGHAGVGQTSHDSWQGSEASCNVQINLNVWTHLVLHLIAPSKQRCALVIAKHKQRILKTSVRVCPIEDKDCACHTSTSLRLIVKQKATLCR